MVANERADGSTSTATHNNIRPNSATSTSSMREWRWFAMVFGIHGRVQYYLIGIRHRERRVFRFGDGRIYVVCSAATVEHFRLMASILRSQRLRSVLPSSSPSLSIGDTKFSGQLLLPCLTVYNRKLFLAYSTVGNRMASFGGIHRPARPSALRVKVASLMHLEL